jgi:hypothetical protein
MRKVGDPRVEREGGRGKGEGGRGKGEGGRGHTII